MTCPVCLQGKLIPGKVTVTLERNASTIVFKDVPAQVCDNCGEEYVDETATQVLLETFDDAVRSGVLMEVRFFVAA